MQFVKIKKPLVFALLCLITAIIVLTVKPDTVTASCMCDCYEVPGSCGATQSTVVENCYLSGGPAACAAGGCSGTLTAFNCMWSF